MTTIKRQGRLQKVALGKMTVHENTQRELQQYRIKSLLADFDIDMLGIPVLSLRGGVYYIVDGQHRIEALKAWLGDGWEVQQIECRVFDSLSEADEADMFDMLNNTLSVRAWDKFRVRVAAKRPTECGVKEVVESQGLRVGKSTSPSVISAVSTLVKIYQRSGPDVLARSLRILRDSYPEAAYDTAAIDGISRLVERYNGTLDEEQAIAKLGAVRGGLTTLHAKAELMHKQTRQGRALCVAAAAVEVINSRRGGKKLPPWFA